MTDGYKKALARIEKAKNKGEAVLDLDNLELTDLPPEIAGLTNLRQLDFSHNLVADLAPIAELTNLTRLDFYQNQVADLAPISGLTNLAVLHFSQNQVADLTPVAKLTNLMELDFSNNEVADLAPISGLTNLTGLDFAQNQVTDLMPISGLKNLRQLIFFQNQVIDLAPITGLNNLIGLGFSENQVVDLAPIAGLNNLTGLGFSQNKVVDLTPIAGLTNLKGLNFSQNQVKCLPEWLLKLKKHLIWPEELAYFKLGFVVSHNPFLEPPAVIVRQGNVAIEMYYNNPRQRLGELKIILVGEGASGKTSLIRRLLDNEFDKNEDQTHGIKIRIEDLTPHGQPTTGRFWDFGGQEIMHATHKFFLSERSVYVLVLNSRKDENPDYWLRHIETYGGPENSGAQTLILFNKSDENPAFDLDRRALLSKYPFIKGFLPVSAATGQGIEAFRKALFDLIADHPLAESKFPTDWIAVKNALEKEDGDYIDYDYFRRICTKNGVATEASQEFLLRALNDLGVALHFEKLRGFNTQVLNPLWLTNAVYRIINSPVLGPSKGILPLSKVGEMLADKRYGGEHFTFPREKWLFIVRIMEQFELCYESKREEEFIVPERLPAAGDANVELQPGPGDRSIRLLVRFPEFMPTSIFPRLMVRTNHLIRGEMRWRTAMQLEENDLFQSQARITADRDDKTILIEVAGRNPRGFLSVLRKELESIRSSFKELKEEEWVPIEGKVSVKYDTLLAHENRNRKDYFCPELEQDFEVEKLLNGIEEEEMRSEEARIPVSAFISYAHEDEDKFEALKRFKQSIYSQVRLGNVELWDDGAILAGENWSNAIWQKFERADLIICLLSPSFIASDFCFEKELAKALEAHEKGEKVIFPVRLIDCDCAELPIGKLQGSPGEWLNLGQKGEPKHELWAEMARKFSQLVKDIKQRKLKERNKRGRGGEEPF